MATFTWTAGSKMYFPSSGTPPIDTLGSGNVHADWDATINTGLQTFPLNMTGATSGTAMTNIESTGAMDPAGELCMVQYVTPYRLAAQSFSTTLTTTLGIMMRISITGATYVSYAIRIVTPAGSLVGSFLSPNTTSNLVNSSSYTHEFRLNTSQADGISCSDGDYLVVELGFDTTTTSSKTWGVKIGDSSAGDVSADDAGTTVQNGHISWNEDITFLESMVPQKMMTGVGL